MLYDSIDNCPIGIFQKVSETGDLRLLIKSGKYSHDKLIKAWEKVYNEVIEQNGLPSEYKDSIRFRIKALQEFDLAYNHGQRFRVTLGNVALQQAIEILGSDKKANFNEVLAMLSKKMGFRIDKNIISVAEYLAYIKINK